MFVHHVTPGASHHHPREFVLEFQMMVTQTTLHTDQWNMINLSIVKSANQCNLYPLWDMRCLSLLYWGTEFVCSISNWSISALMDFLKYSSGVWRLYGGVTLLWKKEKMFMKGFIFSFVPSSKSLDALLSKSSDPPDSSVPTSLLLAMKSGSSGSFPDLSSHPSISLSSPVMAS